MFFARGGKNIQKLTLKIFVYFLASLSGNSLKIVARTTLLGVFESEKQNGLVIFVRAVKSNADCTKIFCVLTPSLRVCSSTDRFMKHRRQECMKHANFVEITQKAMSQVKLARKNLLLTEDSQNTEFRTENIFRIPLLGTFYAVTLFPQNLRKNCCSKIEN